MANNVNVTPGNGATIAADELADGSKVQYVKLMDGTTDGESKAAVGAAGLKTDMGSLIAGEDLEADVIRTRRRNTYTYISTATTTLIQDGEGHLDKIIVTGGTAGTIVLYNNTTATGDIIASFDSTNALEAYLFDVDFSVGLTVVTGSATKLTVVTGI